MESQNAQIDRIEPKPTQTQDEERRHPKEHDDCTTCGADDWSKCRDLPQVGQTYECTECHTEHYVYNSGYGNQLLRKWERVTDSMLSNLK